MVSKIYLKRAAAIASALAVVSSVCPASMASELNGTKEILCKVGDNLTVSDNSENAKETQKLIDERPDIQRPVADMNRGLVAVSTGNGTFISWRWQGYESLDVKYNLYKNGVKLNDEPMSLTNYTDINPTAGAKYSVAPVENGVEGEKCEEVSVWDDGYLEIPIDRPEAVAIGNNAGTYQPGDASVADLDGDGEYEIVLKWDGVVADAGKGATTSNCIIDAYKLSGKKLWRIDMGVNIRSGPHDTQFIVGDFDNDGKAEMACRTADGTVAGDGTVIGDGSKDWRDANGKNLTGPLYLTVFNGEDGSVVDTVPYFQQSTGTYSDGTKWDISSWGDDWGNRSERYLGAMACVDGVHTSFIQSRGYYDRTCIASYHLENGKIVNDWEFDSEDPKYKAEDGSYPYNGQGYHNLSVADVDYDGKDELIFGQLVLDDNGEPMYTTKQGHGDSMHVGDFVPSNPGLEVYTCEEHKGADYGFMMRDARTGTVLYGLQTGTDNGRACVADIDPAYEGEESWSAYGVLTAADGTVISTNYSMPANFAIYWDGDLGREIEDGNGVYKWDPKGQEINPIFKAVGAHSINAAKSNPCLQADIFGDWREELIYAADDMEHLRIYTTDIPTSYRIPTLMHDGEYLDAIGWQNVCYNQPPHLDYYLGYDTKTVPVPQISVTKKDGTVLKNPELSKKSWDISDLYFGDTVELVPQVATALVNGAKVRVDSDNADIVPYINEDNRTMVPLSFIANAYGVDVDYDNGDITIGIDNKVVKMTIGDIAYSIDGEQYKMDTAPVVKLDRTFVPLRVISEALGKQVTYVDGLVYISTVATKPDSAQASATIEKIKSTSVPEAVNHNYSAFENYGDESANLRIAIKSATMLNKLDYSVKDAESGTVATPAPDATPAPTEEPKDASAVLDYDLNTSVTIPAGGCLTIDNGSWAGVPAAVIAFGDNVSHKFRIDYSSNGETWQIALADRVSDGVSGQYEKFYFGVPLYPRYIRYVSMDDTDTVISEFAQARVD